MILQPAILALLGAAAAALAGTLAAVPHAWHVVRRWDRASGDALQIELERRNPLLSAGMALLLGIQAVALFLFVAQADRNADRLAGAMCGVGALRANPWGFPALVAQMAVFFGAGVWLTLDAVDRRCRDTPFTRSKFALLLALFPLLALSFGLQLVHFLSLRPDVVTSCCASLFAAGSAAPAALLASWPPGPVMLGAGAAVSVAAASALLSARTGRGAVVTAVTGLAAFAGGLVAVVVAVSPYVLEHPGHHCPFCILKAEYGRVGWALYLPLFGAAAASLGAGALSLLRREDGDAASAALVVRAVRLLSLSAVAGFLLFLAVAAWRIAASRLILLGDA